jgi:hypothetical protein
MYEEVDVSFVHTGVSIPEAKYSGVTPYKVLTVRPPSFIQTSSLAIMVPISWYRFGVPQGLYAVLHVQPGCNQGRHLLYLRY